MTKPLFVLCLSHNKGRVKYPALICFLKFRESQSAMASSMPAAREVQTMFRPLFLAR
jgi:hypothetical protein